MYSKKYGSVTIIHTTMEVFTVYTNLDMKEPLCAECRTCKALPLSYIVQSLLFLVRPVYRPGFGKNMPVSLQFLLFRRLSYFLRLLNRLILPFFLNLPPHLILHKRRRFTGKMH